MLHLRAAGMHEDYQRRTAIAACACGMMAEFATNFVAASLHAQWVGE